MQKIYTQSTKGMGERVKLSNIHRTLHMHFDSHKDEK